MSNKRTGRPTAGNDGNDDDNDNDEGTQQSNERARLDSNHAGASAAGGLSLASDASSAASSSASALPPTLSPAQRLYSDALISVFGFLDLAELIRAHASCRSWRDAAHKEPSRKIALRCHPSELAWFCATPLHHHVGEYFSGVVGTLEQFASLSAFPALTRVTMDVDSSPLAPLAALREQVGYAEAIAATVVLWPSSLRYLNVGLAHPAQVSAFAASQVLIDCIGRLVTLTELELPGLRTGSPTLQPLLQLTQLQTLHLAQYSLSAADCSVLKQLRSLTQLDLQWADLSLEALQALCTPPHQLASLQWIDFSGIVTAAHMEALTQLPALSTLDLGTLELAATAYLPRFPQLHTLHLHVRTEAISAFMPHLTQCAQISTLEIRFSDIALADLAELTRALTALTSLTFRCVSFGGLDRPDSLACLRTLPQLCELEFDRCPGVRLAHLTDPAFTSLASLRSLRVHTPETDFTEACALFKVPCDFMPQLLSCRLE